MESRTSVSDLSNFLVPFADEPWFMDAFTEFVDKCQRRLDAQAPPRAVNDEYFLIPPVISNANLQDSYNKDLLTRLKGSDPLRSSLQKFLDRHQHYRDPLAFYSGFVKLKVPRMPPLAYKLTNCTSSYPPVSPETAARAVSPNFAVSLHYQRTRYEFIASLFSAAQAPTDGIFRERFVSRIFVTPGSASAAKANFINEQVTAFTTIVEFANQHFPTVFFGIPTNLIDARYFSTQNLLVNWSNPYTVPAFGAWFCCLAIKVLTFVTDPSSSLERNRMLSCIESARGLFLSGLTMSGFPFGMVYASGRLN